MSTDNPERDERMTDSRAGEPMRMPLRAAIRVMTVKDADSGNYLVSGSFASYFSLVLCGSARDALDTDYETARKRVECHVRDAVVRALYDGVAQEVKAIGKARSLAGAVARAQHALDYMKNPDMLAMESPVGKATVDSATR